MVSEIASFRVVLSLALDSFLTVYTDQYSSECWRDACRSLEFSPCVLLFSWVSCPANSTHSDLPGLPALPPDLRGTLRAPCILSHCAMRGLETQVSELGWVWASSPLFSISQDHCSLLHWQCSFPSSLSFSVVFGELGNPAPVTPSWLGVEIC